MHTVSQLLQKCYIRGTLAIYLGHVVKNDLFGLFQVVEECGSPIYVHKDFAGDGVQPPRPHMLNVLLVYHISHGI